MTTHTQLKARVAELEKALEPFALRGLTFASVGMDLTAKGGDPRRCGGTWCIDNNGKAELTFDSHLFMDANHVYGVEKTRLLMQSNIAHLAELTAAQKESDASTSH